MEECPIVDGIYRYNFKLNPKQNPNCASISTEPIYEFNLIKDNNGDCVVDNNKIKLTENHIECMLDGLFDIEVCQISHEVEKLEEPCTIQINEIDNCMSGQRECCSIEERIKDEYIECNNTTAYGIKIDDDSECIKLRCIKVDKLCSACDPVPIWLNKI